MCSKRQDQQSFDVNTAQVFRYFNESRPIQWVGGKQPLAEPPCGFKGERCVYQPDWRIIGGLGFLASLALVAIILAARYLQCLFILLRCFLFCLAVVKSVM